MSTKSPSAVAALTQAGTVDARLVHGVFADEIIKQRVEAVGLPPTSLGALWRDHDEWKSFPLLDELGRAVLGNQFKVVTPFTRTVQENQ